MGDGYRTSEASWLEVMKQLTSLGLSMPPEAVVGDGALLLADVIQGVPFKDGERVEPGQQQVRAEAAVHQI